MNTPGTNIGGMETGTGNPFVELHQFLPLFEPPEKRGKSPQIQGMGGNGHEVIENSGDLTKDHPNVLGPNRWLRINQLLHGQRVGMLLGHHGNIVQAVEIGESLEITLVFNELLGTAVKQTNVWVCPLHHFAPELKY